VQVNQCALNSWAEILAQAGAVFIFRPTELAELNRGISRRCNFSVASGMRRPPFGQAAQAAGWKATASRAARAVRSGGCAPACSTGATQPLEQVWNYQGMGNNGVQTVGVTVR